MWVVYTSGLQVCYCTIMLLCYEARILVHYALAYSELAISPRFIRTYSVWLLLDVWKRVLSVLYLFCLVLQ
jgi:hypothetical protein